MFLVIVLKEEFQFEFIPNLSPVDSLITKIENINKL